MLLLTVKNVLVCDSELRANAPETRYARFTGPQAKTKATLEPRRGQKRASTQPLPDLEGEVTSTVPVVSGSSSNPDVPVDSSVAASMSVEYMVQTSVISTKCWSPTGQFWYRWIAVCQ